MLGLPFACLLERDLLRLSACEDAATVHDLGKLGRNVLPLLSRSLEHVEARVPTGLGRDSRGAGNGSNGDEERDQVEDVRLRADVNLCKNATEG